MTKDVFGEWNAVERIPYGRVRADDREALLEFVETPFKKAVGVMFDKNVPTVGSSCNIHDYDKGYAWISVDYEFMTARNQKVVDRYKHTQKFEVMNRHIGRIVIVAGLIFPIELYNYPNDIGEQAVELADKFYDQPDFLPKNV